MNAFNSARLNQAVRAVEYFRAQGRRTVSGIDIIRRVQGGTYLTDAGMDPGPSPNAQFGRLISQNASTLGIVKLRDDLPAFDDRTPPHRTSCALYEL